MTNLFNKKKKIKKENKKRKFEINSTEFYKINRSRKFK